MKNHIPKFLQQKLDIKDYTFNDVFTDVIDIPKIYYKFNGRKRRYYPDIYIPKENKIIEVKSEGTLNRDKDINIAKFFYRIELGYDFKLEIR